MANPDRDNYFDWKSIITGVMTAAFVSLGSTVWFIGGIDNRVDHLEKSAGRIESVDDKLNLLSQQMASMSTDLNYIKENINSLNRNSQALSGDVRELKIKMTLVEKGNGK